MLLGYAVRGGAGGLGAEGKIKGLRSKWPLEPCLHIIFYGAMKHMAERKIHEYVYRSMLYTVSISRSFTELTGKCVS